MQEQAVHLRPLNALGILHPRSGFRDMRVIVKVSGAQFLKAKISLLHLRHSVLEPSTRGVEVRSKREAKEFRPGGRTSHLRHKLPCFFDEITTSSTLNIDLQGLGENKVNSL